MLAKLRDKDALRTSCCAVETLAWLVVASVACIVRHVRLPVGSYGRATTRGKGQPEPLLGAWFGGRSV